MVKLTKKEKEYIDPGVMAVNLKVTPLYPVQSERSIEPEKGYVLVPKWLRNTNKGSGDYLENMLLLQNISIPA